MKCVPRTTVFHVVRNGELSGTVELFELFEQTLRQTLPPDWLVTAVPVSELGRHRPDMVLRLAAPDGAAATVLVEMKRFVDPRGLPPVLRQIRSLSDALSADSAVLLTPFVSQTIKDKLAEAGVGWCDATGNVRIRTNSPALFVDRVGAIRNPFSASADRRLKSLRGPAAARVVRTLCDVDLPIGVRHLADRARVATGSSARVLDLLDREEIIERGPQGEVLAVRKQSAVRRWAEDYGVTSSNEVTPLLDPRGVEHAMGALDPSEPGHAVTGSAASRAYLPSDVVPVAPLTTLVIHTSQPLTLIRRAKLRSVERGANVLIVRPFDDVVLDGARLVHGVRYAAPVQVVADLLTGPGRSREEAEQLIRMFASTDQAWSA